VRPCKCAGESPAWVDLAERLGAACESGERVDDRPLDELLHSSTLRPAADGILRLARAHFCTRVVLTDTLARPDISRQGVPQMLMLISYPYLGITDAHFNSVLWFLGRQEHHCHGRLWARLEDGSLPAAPQHLCTLARGLPQRVTQLVSLFRHSAVLRESLRLFLDAHSAGYTCRALDFVALSKPTAALDLHMRRLSHALLRVAIEHCEYSSVWLLTALQHVAADPALQQRLQRACFIDFHVGCGQLHTCHKCEFRADRIRLKHTAASSWQCFTGASEELHGWEPPLRPERVTRLDDLCLDVARQMSLRELGLQMADVTETPVADVSAEVAELERLGKVCAAARVVVENCNEDKRLNHFIRRNRLNADWLIYDRVKEICITCCPHKRYCTGGPMIPYIDWRERDPGYSYTTVACDGCSPAVCSRSGVHRRERRPLPASALAYLLDSVAPFLAANADQCAAPPPPLELEYSDHEGDDWAMRADEWDRWLEEKEERRKEQRRKRLWAPFAYP